MLSDLFIITVILIVVLIGFNATKHSYHVLEGMVNKEKSKSEGDDSIVDIVTIAKNQAEITEAALNSLNRKEHAKHYGEILGSLSLWTMAKMVDQTKVLSHKLKTKTDMNEISKMISDINQMKTFRTAIDDMIKFI